MSHKILVVDDEQEACDLASQVLDSAGYEVEVANNATEARACLQKSDFAAVLLDHHMPGEKGEAIANELLKTMHPDRIFYVTADSDLSKYGGLLTFVQKPYDPRVLLLMLKNVLAKTPS